MKTKLNILLILSDPFDSKMPARPEVMEIYGDCLPKLGHRITWLLPSRESNCRISKDMYGQIPIYKILYPSASKFTTNIINFIKYYFMEYKFIFRLFQKNNYDIIQVRNDIFASLIALYIKRRYGIPFVFQYSFPIGFFKSQKKFKTSFSYFFGYFKGELLKYILKQSDLTLPISKWMEIELLNAGIPKSRMLELPMGVNPELFSLKHYNYNILDRYNLKNYNIILYIGSMDRVRTLDIIIKSYSIIIKKHPNTKLLMVGDGNDRKNLEALAVNLKVSENIIFTGSVSYFDIPYYINSANLCLSAIPPFDIYKVSSPTKLFEYMVMSKPIIANDEIPEQEEVINLSGCGILVKYEAEAFAEALDILLKDPKLANEMGKKGYKWVIENRLYRNMANTLEKRYLELFKH